MLYRNGFSLVELSIVLVILGLLTGGILTGQNLIRAAELRSVSTEMTTYQTAVYSFRAKYFAIPGDINNATRFWGEFGDDASSSGACPAPVGVGTETCDGDGDGKIEQNGGNAHEIFQFWRQLANAGMVEGSYTGVDAPGSSNDDAIIGQNVPASKLSNTGYTPMYITGDTSHWMYNYVYPTYGTNVLFYGAKDPNDLTDAAALIAEEAWNIDKKVDDGKPATGIIRPYINSSRGDCADSDASDAEYQLSNTNVGCNLIFNLGI